MPIKESESAKSLKPRRRGVALAATELTMMVKFVVVVPSTVTGLAANAAVVPVGTPETLRATVPLNPPLGVIVTGRVNACPIWAFAVAGRLTWNEAPLVTGGATVMVMVVVPVLPFFPPAIEAAYMVTVVLVLTAGAVQLKVQLKGAEESAAVCVISFEITWVPWPAAKVPSVTKTSRPPRGEPLFVNV
jgi:hypothetical protein